VNLPTTAADEFIIYHSCHQTIYECHLSHTYLTAIKYSETFKSRNTETFYITHFTTA